MRFILPLANVFWIEGSFEIVPVALQTTGQGSVLGPSLFVFDISDICLSIGVTSQYMYTICS